MRLIGRIGCGFCAAVLLWAFISWVDIVADNCKPNPQHSEYNMFVLMTK